MSLIGKLHEAKANRLRVVPTPGGYLWNGCTVKSAMMASSELLRSCCSISLRFLSTVEEPARVGAWRN